MKLYGNNPSNGYTNFCKIVAELTGFEYEFVKVTKGEVEEYKKSTYSQGLFPYLKDETTGEGLGESLAIARLMCNSKPESGLYGTTLYENALIDEAIERHLFAWNQFIYTEVVAALGYVPLTEKKHNELDKKLKDYFAKLNDLLKDKQYFVEEKLTLADVYICVITNLPMATILDAEFRSTIPHFITWYERVRANSVILSHLGKQRYIGEALQPKIIE